MMLVRFSFTWQPTSGVDGYEVYRYDLAAGLAALIGTVASSVTSTAVPVDEAADAVYQVRGHFADDSRTVAQTFYRGRPNILAVFRSEVRRELKDTDPSTYRWSDDELNQYVREAMLDYSRHFPFEKVTTFTTAEQVTQYALPDALTIGDVIYDRWQVKFHLKPKGWKGGEVERMSASGYDKLYVFRVGSRFYGGHYDYRDGEIQLDFDPGNAQTIEVHYGTFWPLPLADTDPLGVPPIDEEILSLYVQGKAWMRVGGQDASLSRWNEDHKRDDSPIIPRETRLFNAYFERIRERKARPRTIRRVRI